MGASRVASDPRRGGVPSQPRSERLSAARVSCFQARSFGRALRHASIQSRTLRIVRRSVRFAAADFQPRSLPFAIGHQNFAHECVCAAEPVFGREDPRVRSAVEHGRHSGLALRDELLRRRWSPARSLRAATRSHAAWIALHSPSLVSGSFLNSGVARAPSSRLRGSCLHVL
jgi:hypothetical protein